MLGDSPPMLPKPSKVERENAFLVHYDMEKEESFPPDKRVTVYFNNFIIQVKKYIQRDNFDLKVDLVQIDTKRIPTDHSSAFYVDAEDGTKDFPKWLETNLNVGSAVAEKVYEVLEEIVWAHANEFDIPVLGFWSSWEPWGPCKSKCAPGHLQRVRHCIRIKHAWCRGGNQEQKKADLENFAGKAFKLTDVEGVTGIWSEWSACSASCGSAALKTRSRQCDSQGQCTETLNCDLPPCTGNISFNF